jgi:hypothetical protein
MIPGIRKINKINPISLRKRSDGTVDIMIERFVLITSDNRKKPNICSKWYEARLFFEVRSLLLTYIMIQLMIVTWVPIEFVQKILRYR